MNARQRGAVARRHATHRRTDCIVDQTPDVGGSIFSLLVPGSELLRKMCWSIREVQQIDPRVRDALRSDGLRYVVDLILRTDRLPQKVQRALTALGLQFDLLDPVLVMVLQSIAEVRVREERWEVIGAEVRRRVLLGEFANALPP